MASKEHRPLAQIQGDLAKAKTERTALDAKIAGFENELQELAQAAAEAAGLETYRLRGTNAQD